MPLSDIQDPHLFSDEMRQGLPSLPGVIAEVDGDSCEENRCDEMALMVI